MFLGITDIAKTLNFVKSMSFTSTFMKSEVNSTFNLTVELVSSRVWTRFERDYLFFAPFLNNPQALPILYRGHNPPQVLVDPGEDGSLWIWTAPVESGGSVAEDPDK